MEKIKEKNLYKLQIIFFIVVFFLFNNDKGEKNEGQNKDIHGLKYCASSLATIEFGSLRPLTVDSYSTNWGEDVL